MPPLSEYCSFKRITIARYFVHVIGWPVSVHVQFPPISVSIICLFFFIGWACILWDIFEFILLHL